MFGRASKKSENIKYDEVFGVPKSTSADVLKKGGDPEKEGMSIGGPSHDPFDIFPSFFGNSCGNPSCGAPGSSRGLSQPRGIDVFQPLKPSLDLYNNITAKKLLVSPNVLCFEYQGNRSKSCASMKCACCKGFGIKLSIRQLGPSMIQPMLHPCNECKGTGESVNEASNLKNDVSGYISCVVPTNDVAMIQTFTRRIQGLKPGSLMEFEVGLNMNTMGFICGDNEKVKWRFIVFPEGPPFFPRRFGGLRRLAAPVSISMEGERETQKKKPAAYCDEIVEPQEMNEKDNQLVRQEREKSVRVSWNIRLKGQVNPSTQEIALKLNIEKTEDKKLQIDALRREKNQLRLELYSVKERIKWPDPVNIDEYSYRQLFVLFLKGMCGFLFEVSPWLLFVVYVFFI